MSDERARLISGPGFSTTSGAFLALWMAPVGAVQLARAKTAAIQAAARARVRKVFLIRE